MNHCAWRAFTVVLVKGVAFLSTSVKSDLICAFCTADIIELLVLM